MKRLLFSPLFFVILSGLAFAQGSDECGSATPIAGYGAFPFDTNGATTGAEGQNNPTCYSFGSTVIFEDVWYTWTAPQDGTVKLSTCKAFGDTKVAVYEGAGCPTITPLACNDDACGKNGFMSEVEFSATLGSEYLLQIGNFPGTGGSFGSMELGPGDGGGGGNPPANDDCDDATGISESFGFLDGTTTGATTDGPGLTCGGIENDVWYSFEIQQAGVFRLVVFPTSMQGMQVLVTDELGASPPAGCPLDVPGQCGVDPSFSLFTFPVDAGDVHVLRVGNEAGGTPGGFSMSFEVCQPPVLTDDPEDAAVCEGSGVTFSAGAIGTEPLSYQWLHNGAVIPGETNPTLNIYFADVTIAGGYVVVVTNPCGEVVSDVAVLSVLQGPEITESPVGGEFCTGDEHTMFVGAVGTGELSFQWFKDGVELTGATDFILDLSDLSLADSGSYSVEVTDDCGTTSSGEAVMSVSFCGDLYEPTSSNNTPFAVPNPCPPCPPKEGDLDPVYLFSGEYYLSEVDLTIPGRGMDFVWGRKYRSRIGQDTAQGVGWDFSYNLSIGQEAGDIVLNDGNSRSDRYELQADGSWTDQGFFRRITEEADGSYRVKFPNTGVWEFHPFDGSDQEGKVTAIEDRHSNRIEFEYSQGRLVVVRDTLGREIDVSYHPNGRVAAVTDFTGRSVSYGYYQAGDPDGGEGDLASVTTPSVVGTPNGNDFPAGKTTFYTYSTGFADEELNHNLLTITDPKGQTWLVNEYDTSDPEAISYDHVVRQTWGDSGDILDVVYAEVSAIVGSGKEVRKAIVNDRVGNVKELFFDAKNQLVRRREYTGRADPDQPTTDPTDPGGNPPLNPLRPGDPAFFETRTEYNDDTLPTKIVYPDENEVLMVYDETNPNPRARGNMLSRTYLPGSRGSADQPDGRTETFEYDDELGGSGCCGTNFVTKHVDFRGNETLHDYDEQGNKIHTQHRIASIVEDCEYNEFGQKTRYIHPDNDGHRRVDDYVFYGSEGGHQEGYLFQSIEDVGGFELTTTFEYDEVGNIVRVIDPKGNDSLVTFNELNQVVQTQSAAVSTALTRGSLRYETFAFYDENDNIVQISVANIDETGAVRPNAFIDTFFTYETLNLLTSIQREENEVDDVVEEFEYDANRNRTLHRKGEATDGDQPANRVVTEYDERDLPFLVAQAGGAPVSSTNQFDYDGSGNPKRVSLGIEDAQRVKLNDYDGYNRLASSTDPMGNVMSAHFDENGNEVSSRVDGELEDIPGSGGNIRLAESFSEFDAMDRRTRERTQHFDSATQTPIGDGESIAEIDWSGMSLPLSVTNDNSHLMTSLYDTALRHSRITDPAGNTMETVYDANSNAVSTIETERSDLGATDEVFTSLRAFDALDRLISTTNNVGSTWTRAYDSRDNLVLSVDPLLREVRYDYDGLDRPLTTRRALEGGLELVTSQAWDDSSRITSRTDDNLNRTIYSYDELDRLTRETFEDLTSRVWTYDVHHNTVSGSDANGTSFVATHDLLDRVLSRTFTPGAGVSSDTTFETLAHDGLSRMVRAVDDDSTVNLAHDSMVNVVSQTLNGHTTASTHDGVGNRTSLTYPGGRALQISHDLLERMKEILDASLPGAPSLIGRYDYIGTARVSRRTLGNGTVMDLSYDGINNAPGDFGERMVVGVNHHIPGGATLFERATSWDRMGNRISGVTRVPGRPVEREVFGYDAVDRMIRSEYGRSFDVPAPPGLLQAERRQDRDYLLDGVGNRVSVQSSPADSLFGDGAYVTNSMNEYLQTPFDTRSYDVNGNLVSIDPGAATERVAVYDVKNRMVEHTDLASGEVTQYAYDALGRRIAKVRDVTGAPSTTRFLYDGWRVVEERDGTDQVLATYAYGNYIDEPLNMQRGGVDRWYHPDDLHNVRAVSDSSGTVVERYEYDDFGEVSILNGAGAEIASSAIDNPYLFNGRRLDQETRWYYYRTRYLDPRVGGFTTRDTIGQWADTLNLGNARAYLAHNPINKRDPMGLDALEDRFKEVFDDVIDRQPWSDLEKETVRALLLKLIRAAQFKWCEETGINGKCYEWANKFTEDIVYNDNDLKEAVALMKSYFTLSNFVWDTDHGAFLNWLYGGTQHEADVFVFPDGTKIFVDDSNWSGDPDVNFHIIGDEKSVPGHATRTPFPSDAALEPRGQPLSDEALQGLLDKHKE
jgi:RHS repeat-associated protein